MTEAAYADLEALGEVLNEDGEDTDRNIPRCASELGKEAHRKAETMKPVGRSCT